MSIPGHRSTMNGLLRARPRLYSSTLIGCIIAVVTPGSFSTLARILIGWDCGVTLYLGLAFWLMGTATQQSIRRRAVRQRDGRWVVLSLITGAALASLIAIAQILGTLKGMSPQEIALHIILAAVTIIASWLFVNTIFAQIYAHEFFAPGRPAGQVTPLDFPNEPEPDYWDFVYFAMVIGMTCQVSDVPVRSRLLRRVVLIHSVLSFFFNTVLVALSVNIAASLL